MEMKSEVGVCSEEEVGEGKGKGDRIEMEVGVCDRVDATESMRQSRWNGGQDIGRVRSHVRKREWSQEGGSAFRGSRGRLM